MPLFEGFDLRARARRYAAVARANVPQCCGIDRVTGCEPACQITGANDEEADKVAFVLIDVSQAVQALETLGPPSWTKPASTTTSSGSPRVRRT